MRNNSCLRSELISVALERNFKQSGSTTSMIEKIFILLGLLSLSLCASLDQQWHSWKSQHSKSYGNEDEEDARRTVWYDNFKKIVDHNNANHSYSLGLNEFADLVRLRS